MTEYIEIIALVTGLFVIIIETAIIFLLNRHMKALDLHLCKNEELVKQLETNINDHLDHLNKHSHEIERKLERICGPNENQAENDNNKNGITSFKHVRESV